MFENLSSSEWLLYISEWQYCNTMISNIRCTTKVAVNSLLSDNAVLQERGSAIIHNLACKEVKTVVCIPHTHKSTYVHALCYSHSSQQWQQWATRHDVILHSSIMASMSISDVDYFIRNWEHSEKCHIVILKYYVSCLFGTHNMHFIPTVSTRLDC